MSEMFLDISEDRFVKIEIFSLDRNEQDYYDSQEEMKNE